MDELMRSPGAIVKNPLGIIALFIFLIYSMASLVLGLSAEALNENQRWVFVSFLAVFPFCILFSFIWLVVKHPTKLYSPSDFRDDQSYVSLNQQMKILAVRQEGASIDPRGKVSDAVLIIRELLRLEQVGPAKSVGKAFLKVGRFEDGLKLFDEIGDHLRSRNQSESPVLSYQSYCLIGLGRFDHARRVLEQLKMSAPGMFDFWPTLALAYCYLKQDRMYEYENALRSAASTTDARGYVGEVRKLYGDISVDFERQLGAV